MWPVFLGGFKETTRCSLPAEFSRSEELIDLQLLDPNCCNAPCLTTSITVMVVVFYTVLTCLLIAFIFAEIT